ncbi:class I SAM-dependent methyltransferase [Laspinema olomoucense]|uniref:Methyltransferase domain-containing protein n=1 Tax=Laspinema olomoucense D3b TaxID=2953688 RepID=A0ABT2N5D8_9CYAN|nr:MULTISPECIES: class I SAM-dependent methyltransferase [unclassified Laspinema]MCT7977903.1 methyltransferase domain-containing protein [Laspinema sp. D3b]MCT7994323.1 methyltransferase domain-containing protein [Laspinema sp. D3c]
MSKMQIPLPWQYDEFQQVGKDYGIPTEVEMYDSSHADFRDIEQESNAVLDLLALNINDVVIDFGAGTGTFAIQAAIRGLKVYAVDVSPTMLEYAKTKAAQAGVSNIITFCHGGFLSYEHPENSVDAITTTFAFHHLPDFWKGIALGRMNRMLKPGGQFYIHDVIISEHHSLDNIAAFIEKQAAAGGDFLREDAQGHFRDEFSTYDWIFEGLLSRNGFSITSQRIEDGVMATYLCTKTLNPM